MDTADNTLHHRNLPSVDWKLIHRVAAVHGFSPTIARLHNAELGVHIAWNSRSHRKGRNTAVVLTKDCGHKVHRKRLPKLWGWQPDNVSWWVAQLFTWGSIAWVVNGFFVFLPTSHEELNKYMVGYTALLGGTLFEAGAYLMVVEALNAGRTVRFGYEVERAVEDGLLVLRPHKHYHHRRPIPDCLPVSSDGNPGDGGAAAGSQEQNAPTEDSAQQILERAGAPRMKPTAMTPPDRPAFQIQSPQQQQQEHCRSPMPSPSAPAKHKSSMQPISGPDKWRWWGFEGRDLGFLGSFVSFLAATVFWISTITGVPGVMPDEETHPGLWDALFWTPQVVGGIGFIIGSILFMLETQTRWWRIAPSKLGWQVGFWNLVGALGFFFSGLFGYWAVPADRYQKWGTEFSTFWGGWAFLIGSYVQLFEVLNPHPQPEKEE